MSSSIVVTPARTFRRRLREGDHAGFETGFLDPARIRFLNDELADLIVDREELVNDGSA